MRCPSCGTHHPPQYEQCVSCGQDFHLEDADNTDFAQAAPSDLSEGVDFEGAASASAGARSTNSAQSAKSSKASRGGKRDQEHFAVQRSSRDLDFDQDEDDAESPQGERRKDERSHRAAPKRRSQSVKPDIRSGMPGTSAL